MTTLYQDILNELLTRSTPISGQTLANQYKASRNAIWKNIEKLRQEGYDIQTVHKAGYLLTKPSQQLEIQQIQLKLNSFWNNLTILIHSEVTSTNDFAKQYAIQNPGQSALIIAKKQTQGRGRRGRTFHSEIENGLYLSLHIQPTITSQEDIPLYTLAAATAMCQALTPHLDEPLDIKWVNDVFYKGRKVAGILCEATTDLESASITGVTIGIGLNLAGNFNHADSQTQQVAGTLFGTSLPPEFNPNHLVRDFLNYFAPYHQNLSNREFINYYGQHLLGLGKAVTYTDQSISKQGRIRGVNQNGHLLIEQADGQIHELFSQEIHFSSHQFIQEEP